MIILRNKLYSSKKKDDDNNKNVALAATTGGTGAVVLGNIKKNRLTGKVVRYHDAPIEVIDKIKEEGLKTKYADDPNNLTNQVLHDVPKEEKTGKIYTAKKKKTAFDVGTTRARNKGKIGEFDAVKEQLIQRSPHHKVLKIELDYDEDIKGKKHIKNPELRGAKNAKEFFEKRPHGLFEFVPDKWDKLDPVQKLQQKAVYDSLSEKGTHIFDHDIDSSKIVGGKGYKKRTLKQIGKYIKNNPKRFGKEATKLALGASLLEYGAKKAIDAAKKNEKDND